MEGVGDVIVEVLVSGVSVLRRHNLSNTATVASLLMTSLTPLL